MPLPQSLVELTTEIVTAHLSHNGVTGDLLPELIKNVYAALASLGNEPKATAEASNAPEPAVTVRKSLSNPDRIISMIDGRPYSSLKRHLTKHGYTPESYRAAFNLRPDYPMVAPGYAALRKELAVNIGLGRKNSRWNKIEETPDGAVDDQETLPRDEPIAVPENAPTKVRRPRKKADTNKAPEQRNEPVPNETSGAE
ncbi:putative transcriptional regulator [Novosphingobium chloroacetimidivorans]|uniref:Putative transcriptional regulator n=1 Tax=Novosphingobium chloroacetimidivorans TaxID=1428314 RepID=A0A7W7NY13_9SPHN|nr:MucR family transcriptional regulator [Novosphingobium chloroacetimidivorans]MBB4860961.1 putative transcriptional regulator [Novosphingobium chloroacetimidivorans]